MKTRLLLLAPLVIAGCASTSTPQYDLQFGEAVRQARERQTLNPSAGATAPTVLGLDGKAAQEGLTLYRNTFKAPPPVVNVINIGGSTGGSSR